MAPHGRRRKIPITYPRTAPPGHAAEPVRVDMGAHARAVTEASLIVPQSDSTWVSVMSTDGDYIYDEATGEWLSPSEAAERAAAAGVEVRDSAGNLLSDGDSVVLIKDLTVKGANQTLKRGTLIKTIRLTGDAQEIDCRYPGIKGLVLRAEFVRKS